MSRECKTCHNILPIGEFGSHKLMKDGINTECKACNRKRAYKWRIDNTEKHRSYSKDYRLKHIEEYKEYKHKKYKREKEKENTRRSKYRATHIEQEKERFLRWYEQNKEKFRVYSFRRRAIKRNINERFLARDIKRVFELFDFACANCGSIDNLHIDHHYPLVLGNALSPQNAVILCKTCNSKKGFKMPDLFYTPKKLAEIESKLFNERKKEHWEPSNIFRVRSIHG